METTKTPLVNPENILDKQTEEDGEKENVNVVIVPESILQAIKNSSNINLNATTANNCGTSTQSPEEQKSTIEGAENLINSSNVVNPVLWVAFPVGSNSPSQNNTQLCSNSIQSHIETQELRDSSHAEIVSYNNCSQNESVKLSSPVQIPLYSNSLMPELSRSDNADLFENTPKFFVQNSSSGLYLAMCVQSVENDGDKSTYTLAPASSIDEYAQQVNVLGRTSTMPATAEVEDVCAQKSVDSETFPANISHQQMVKQSKTANKGTCTTKSKPVYPCDFEGCKAVFKSALQCRKHKTVTHEEEKPYKCKYANCMWSFKTPYKLRRHLESHYQRKPYVCPFPGCDASFSNDYNQRVHFKLHTALRACEICGEILTNKRKLAAHMRTAHDAGPTFVCNVCNKHCLTKAALVVHKRTHYPQMYDCPMCDKKFTKSYQLKTHILAHTGEKPFQCDHCDLSFVSVSRLNRHIHIHSEKRFKCSHKGCDKKFHRFHHLFKHLQMRHLGEENDETDLQTYLNKATGGNPNYFTCETCNLDCLSLHGLERHKLKCKQNSSASFAECSKTYGTTENFSNADKGGNLSASENVLQHSLCETTPINEATLKVILTNEEKIPKVGCTSSTSTSLPQLTSSNDVIMLDDTWTAAYSSDGLTENMQDSQYMTCPSRDADSQISLVPFMEDMGVLSDASTQQFLQMNDDIVACVESVSVTVDSSEIEQPDNSDVLQKYVVGSDHLEKKNSLPNEDIQTSSLFDSSDIPLASIDDTRTLRTNTHFSGTTININDIH